MNEIVKPLWVGPINFLGDIIRRTLGVGPEWKMHLRLARRLVDKQLWFMIPLTSGTQSPIFDAIEYLVVKRDRDSLPRLEALFQKYCGIRNAIHRERLEIGTVTYCYGPQYYVPLDVQYAAARALLKLYLPSDASQFLMRVLNHEKLWSLGDRTLSLLLSHAIRYKLNVPHEVIHTAFENYSQRFRVKARPQMVA